MDISTTSSSSLSSPSAIASRVVEAESSPDLMTKLEDDKV